MWSLLEGADLSAKTSEWVGLRVAWQRGRWKGWGGQWGPSNPGAGPAGGLGHALLQVLRS